MDLTKFESGASASPPSAPASPSSGYPSNGNPGTGTAATVPGDYWFYQILKEFENFLTAGGITPNSAVLTQMRDAAYGIVGVGSVAFFARATAPTGWLKANGAAVSRTTYAALFAAIGTVFGAGDGSTTFNLPDLRGRFPRGWSDGHTVDAGRGFGTTQEATSMLTNGVNAFSDASGSRPYVNLSDYDSAVNESGNRLHIDASVDNQEAFTYSRKTMRPTNVALLACIKY
jgi:phage-related tail fiber protein